MKLTKAATASDGTPTIGTVLSGRSDISFSRTGDAEAFNHKENQKNKKISNRSDLKQKKIILQRGRRRTYEDAGMRRDCASARGENPDIGFHGGGFRDLIFFHCVWVLVSEDSEVLGFEMMERANLPTYELCVWYLYL